MPTCVYVLVNNRDSTLDCKVAAAAIRNRGWICLLETRTCHKVTTGIKAPGTGHAMGVIGLVPTRILHKSQLHGRQEIGGLRNNTRDGFGVVPVVEKMRAVC
jgi:hypothetical protein